MKLARLALLGAWSIAGCGGGHVGALPVAEVATAETTSAPKPAKPAEAPFESAASTSAVIPAPATPAPIAARPDTPAPKEISARHVLIQFLGSERAPASVVRTREQAESLAQKVLAKARRGESFTRLATEYSDEPGAAGRGGALGRFAKGRMVPAFEEVAFRLKVGELSDLVETPFGFHVILRTE